jgi:hypothetical protein
MVAVTKKILINECSGWYSDILDVIYKSVLLLID